jgi:Uma2 family endonuclease
MPPTARKFTAEDYRAMREGPPWLQLIEGELIQDPSPNLAHQDLAAELTALLRTHAKTFDLGLVLAAPMDVWLSDDNVLQPDILFVSKARRPLLARDGIHGAPDLIVEILSPSSGRRDFIQKRAIYQQAGVAEYWLVDPALRQINLIRFGKRDDEKQTRIVSRIGEISSPLFPGLVIRAESLFAGLESFGE